MRIETFQRMRAMLMEHLADPRAQKLLSVPSSARRPRNNGERAKLGRPRKGGVRPPEHFLRGAVALSAFDAARPGGEKYEVALAAGVQAVRDLFPDLPISATGMKRFLTEFRSPLLENTFFFNKVEDKTAHSRPRVWIVRIGPNPKYERHNAAKRVPQRTRTRLAEAVFKKK
jgi:hypothetical protein